jgi:hypothetical protein
MTDGIDSLYYRIKSRLIEYDFEPTTKRADGIFYTMMWSFSYQMNNIPDNVIDEYIKDVYNFERYRNTRLAQKMLKDDIIKTTDKWIYVRDYGDKK